MIDDNTEEPVELRTLQDILGAYARQVLGWHGPIDDERDDDEEGSQLKSKVQQVPASRG